MTTGMWVLAESEFLQGLWQGVFQLIALSIVAGWVHFVYQRYRRRSEARQELIDEIDSFTVKLYKPRKIYQTVINDRHCKIFAGLANETQRETERLRMIRDSLDDVIEAIGRFRSVQVKIVPLYGYNIDIFGYYLAIWRYLKEIRQRMERLETLYFHHETGESVDAFYRLIDVFRYRIMVEKFARKPPSFMRPPIEILQQLRARGDEVYQQFIASATPAPAPATPATPPTPAAPAPSVPPPSTVEPAPPPLAQATDNVVAAMKPEPSEPHGKGTHG